MKTSKFVLLAIAAAGAFATAVAIAQDAQTISPNNATAAVKCYGINSCKGKSECRTATNSCRGTNSCKGTGVLMASNQQDCITKGGSLTEPTQPQSTTQSATQPYGQQ